MFNYLKYEIKVPMDVTFADGGRTDGGGCKASSDTVHTFTVHTVHRAGRKLDMDSQNHNLIQASPLLLWRSSRATAILPLSPPLVRWVKQPWQGMLSSLSFHLWVGKRTQDWTQKDYVVHHRQYDGGEGRVWGKCMPTQISAPIAGHGPVTWPEPGPNSSESGGSTEVCPLAHTLLALVYLLCSTQRQTVFWSSYGTN